MLEELVSLSSSFTHSSNSPISCGSLRNEEPDEKGWVYEPDDTPLPESLLEAIKEGFAKMRIRLRKNKVGAYPTLQAITRLINYLCVAPSAVPRPAGLFQAADGAGRRASRTLLEQMGFPTSSSKKEKIKDALVGAGVLHRGGYIAKSKSRLYTLSSWAMEQLDQDRIIGRTTA